MDTAGLSNNGDGSIDDLARRAALADVIAALEAALATMDDLGLTTAALHVSLGLELARASAAANHP